MSEKAKLDWLRESTKIGLPVVLAIYCDRKYEHAEHIVGIRRWIIRQVSRVNGEWAVCLEHPYTQDQWWIHASYIDRSWDKDSPDPDKKLRTWAMGREKAPKLPEKPDGTVFCPF